jgi:DnaJ-class molecular chaperone
MPLSKTPDKRGDLIIRFTIIFPRYISEDKKAKLRNLLAHPEASS